MTAHLLLQQMQIRVLKLEQNKAHANQVFQWWSVIAGDAVDIQQACVEEAALLAGPVCGLKARLEQLLLEWPEHPVLVQLSAICDRLTGMLSNFFL